MNQKTVLIVDDEPAARRELIALLREFSYIRIIGEASDGVNAENDIVRLKPDIVFLDIQMPERDGLTVAANTASLGYQLVFVTAFDEYAVQAFETHAIDYLLKPVRPERLEKTLKKLFSISKTLSNAESDFEVSKLLNVLTRTHQESRINIRQGSTNLLLSVGHIAYVEAIAGYTRIHLSADGCELHRSQTIISDTSLEKILQTLPEKEFIRVHRSFIVNQSQIRSQRSEGRRSYVQLADFPETPIPVSRSNARLVKERWPTI
jgi:DNA-binding LytR/AlgR family response regulator|tara:strand:+ start:1960 stop:2748 length:789 start_codon:yes stop_codon:yes gene_type:complete